MTVTEIEDLSEFGLQPYEVHARNRKRWPRRVLGLRVAQQDAGKIASSRRQVRGASSANGGNEATSVAMPSASYSGSVELKRMVPVALRTLRTRWVPVRHARYPDLDPPRRVAARSRDGIETPATVREMRFCVVEFLRSRRVLEVENVAGRGGLG